MEHEVFVPVPAERLREALADPARVARAVPGLQQDAGAAPVSGRLKVRVGSHSITYRGSVRVTPQEDGSYAVEGDATETRGTGSVKFTLTLRLSDTEDGTTLTFDAAASADGRVTDLPPAAVGSAATRLLTRFAENLSAATEELRGPEPTATQDFEPSAATDFDTTPDAEDTPPSPITEQPPESKAPETPEEPGPASDAAADGPAAADEPAPPTEDFAEAPEPPAEAAHARRTMIGRSAEEVDHAPPRGRYAPIPAPQTTTPTTTLRWAAPAAALLVASAIAVTRALRKRH